MPSISEETKSIRVSQNDTKSQKQIKEVSEIILILSGQDFMNHKGGDESVETTDIAMESSHCVQHILIDNQTHTGEDNF